MSSFDVYLGRNCLEVVLGRIRAPEVVGELPGGLAATNAGIAGEYIREHPVRLLELEGDRVVVDLLYAAWLPVYAELGRGGGHEVLVAIDILEPEDERV